jgi:diguanylate cyclase (GGDEF)-like protein
MGNIHKHSEQDSDRNSLLNQSQLLEQLLVQWRRAETENLPVSIFIIGVDHFSQLENKSDHFDAIVTAISQQFQRQSDFISSYNRNQIMVITSGLSYRQSTQLASRLHQVVALLKIFHPFSPTGPYATVSIGHSTYSPAKNDSYGILDMMTTVQDHLNQARQAGGNCSRTRLHSRILR